MNTVKTDIETKHNKYKVGDIFAKNGSYYILGCVDFNSYCAINLAYGSRYSDPAASIEEVVKNLIFVGSDVEITINKK